MSRYIDAETLLKSAVSKFKCVPVVGVTTYRNGEECFDVEDFEEFINEHPPADVVEVRHGEWVFGKLGGRDAWVCSLCGAGFTGENAEWIAKEHDFCAKCGAKMDGEKALKERSEV